jgi:heterodisulfide reductase subunit B
MAQNAMTTRTVVMQRTELRCRAEHPSARSEDERVAARFRGRLHNVVIQPLPVLAEPTGRVLATAEEAGTDCIPAYCHECKLYTEYRLVESGKAVA